MQLKGQSNFHDKAVMLKAKKFNDKKIFRFLVKIADMIYLVFIVDISLMPNKYLKNLLSKDFKKEKIA